MSPPSSKSAARSMRARTASFREKGWVRNNFWLSPESVSALDQLRSELSVSSRELTVNAVMELISRNPSLLQTIRGATHDPVVGGTQALSGGGGGRRMGSASRAGS